MAEVLSARLKCLILINGLSLSLLAQRLTHVRQLIKSWYIWFFQVPILSSYWIKRWDKKLTALAYKAGNHLETNPKKSAQALSPFLPHYQSAARALFSSFFQNKIKIEAPTLVLWSGSDAFLEIPSQTEMTKYVSHPTIRVLEGHHWIHQEDSDHVNRLIRQFIEGVK
jgi:epoxide hydrolase 4